MSENVSLCYVDGIITLERSHVGTPHTTSRSAGRRDLGGHLVPDVWDCSGCADHGHADVAGLGVAQRRCVFMALPSRLLLVTKHLVQERCITCRSLCAA